MNISTCKLEFEVDICNGSAVFISVKLRFGFEIGSRVDPGRLTTCLINQAYDEKNQANVTVACSVQTPMAVL